MALLLVVVEAQQWIPIHSLFLSIKTNEMLVGILW